MRAAGTRRANERRAIPTRSSVWRMGRKLAQQLAGTHPSERAAHIRAALRPRSPAGEARVTVLRLDGKQERQAIQHTLSFGVRPARRAESKRGAAPMARPDLRPYSHQALPRRARPPVF